MSHRHRSQCCCGDPIVPQDCFLGYGTPPPPDGGFEPTKDRCEYWPTPYTSAKDQSPYHHWSFCNSSLNEELILTLERDVRVDRSGYGSYTTNGVDPPDGTQEQCVNFFRSNGVVCSNCRDCCTKASHLVGNPESGFLGFGNEPFYVRYRRLKNIPAYESRFIDWESGIQDITNRAYVWRTIGSLKIQNHSWNEATNGGNPLWPLWVNPWEAACHEGNIQEQNRPHGTAIYQPDDTLFNCQEWDSGVGRCKDWSCSTFGGGNSFDCNQEYRGLGNKYLTPAQAQLIGDDDWDTNKYGYVSTSGWARGFNCYPGDDTCRASEDDKIDYYVNQIYEQGGAYFWLQGIADHNAYYIFNPDGSTNDTPRYFESFYYSNGEVLQDFSSYSCDDERKGLRNLNETLAGVFHRETWWEKYWNGYTRNAYERSNPNNVPPDDYFQHNNDSVVEDYTPEFIGLTCSGIPVFTWEIYYLYRRHNNYPPIVSATDIYANRIPEASLNKIRTYIENQGQTAPEFKAGNSNNPDDIRENHLLCFFACLYYNIQMPYQVTDILELYDILPAPTNLGEDSNYKIFEKKLYYYDFTGIQQDGIDTPCEWGSSKVLMMPFYGRPGGWNYMGKCPGLEGPRELIQENILNILNFPSNLDGVRNNCGWNPWPFPIENRLYGYDALNTPEDYNEYSEDILNFCCPDPNNSFSCFTPPLFVYCDTGIGPNQPDPDNPDDPNQPDFPLTCSNYSASITCRGVWFQYHSNDYGTADPITGLPIIGCDTISNSFWLRQDPYEFGPTIRLGINYTEDGLTGAFIDNINTDNFSLTRGIINTIDYSGVIYPHILFKSPDIEINGSTFRSIRFELIIGAKSPDDSDDGLIDLPYTFLERLDYEGDGIIKFNPFEQLDLNEYTKSPDTLYWQIQEVFRDINNPENYYYLPFHDLNGTITLSDIPGSAYACGEEGTIKYSGEAARLYEYQWYHPPYIVTTGTSAIEYIRCAGEDCDSPPWPGCNDIRRNTGQCCNSRQWDVTPGNCAAPKNVGRRAGPRGSETSVIDQYIPPPGGG